MTPIENPTALLAAARAAEKAQALFYRSLAAQAEDAGDEALSQRLNELHADEQHHVSRISARLLELGESLEELGGMRVERTDLAGWEALAHPREAAEVARYERLLEQPLDAHTAALVREILETERHHAEELGGKWTPA